jgi:vacuolar-type H+-ATPase subunit I/STV1
LPAYVYGLRYDAEFLFLFLLLRRALVLWQVPTASLVRIFLVSGGLMLIFSLLIRYVFGEMFLTIFGFSHTIGNAESLTVPPIYHDILDSTIIRFQ